MRSADRFDVFYMPLPPRRVRLSMRSIEQMAARPSSSSHLEGILLQPGREPGEGLVPGAGLGDEGELGGRTVGVAGSDLDAGALRLFVRRRRRGRGEESALRRSRAGWRTDGQAAGARDE
jgi:hypothetical protein